MGGLLATSLIVFFFLIQDNCIPTLCHFFQHILYCILISFYRWEASSESLGSLPPVRHQDAPVHYKNLSALQGFSNIIHHFMSFPCNTQLYTCAGTHVHILTIVFHRKSRRSLETNWGDEYHYAKDSPKSTTGLTLRVEGNAIRKECLESFSCCLVQFYLLSRVVFIQVFLVGFYKCSFVLNVSQYVFLKIKQHRLVLTPTSGHSHTHTHILKHTHRIILGTHSSTDKYTQAPTHTTHKHSHVHLHMFSHKNTYIRVDTPTHVQCPPAPASPLLHSLSQGQQGPRTGPLKPGAQK